MKHIIKMDWAFDTASDGHVALNGQITLDERGEFALALGFGADADQAIETATAAAGKDFEAMAARYLVGWQASFMDGRPWILEWRQPTYLYHHNGGRMKLLTRHYPLSDDVGYRFSNRGWDGWPLMADRYATWLAGNPGDLASWLAQSDHLHLIQWYGRSGSDAEVSAYFTPSEWWALGPGGIAWEMQQVYKNFIAAMDAYLPHKPK